MAVAVTRRARHHTSVFDAVPPQIWLLIALAITAIMPVRYIVRHFAHDPRRREITLPSEDLGWRSSGQLGRSVALVAVLAAVAIVSFTPQAESFARSPDFFAVIMALIGAYAVHTV